MTPFTYSFLPFSWLFYNYFVNLQREKINIPTITLTPYA